MTFEDLLDIQQFLSTPSARRATALPFCPASSRRISIHALREEGDQLKRAGATITRYFYPRPPRGGRPAARTSS